MLKPAILYKDEIEKQFMEAVYTDDYFLYAGNAYDHELPSIELKNNSFQYAIVSNDGFDDLIGYFAYMIEPSLSLAYNFGLYSFIRGNVTVGKDVFHKLEELVEQYHRVEWRMVGTNPVKKSYDKFCKKHNGNILCFHDCVKDNHGKFCDCYIYEIINNSK